MATNQTVPFTKLFVKSKEDIGTVSDWISNEIDKNHSLPSLPFEIWRLIVSKATLEKRKDAVILSDYVITVPNSITVLRVNITPITAFTRKYGQESLETIQRKTFGSQIENERQIIAMLAGGLKIETVLAMA
jgi:hypothetical protein